mgnify:CR=1 FL=1
MDCQEPLAEGKIRRLHDCPTSECGSSAALLTLKLLNCFHPIMFCISPFSAFHSYFKAIIPESIPTRLLIRELFNKLYKLHFLYLESKLESVSLTYLRSGI